MLHETGVLDVKTKALEPGWCDEVLLGGMFVRTLGGESAGIPIWRKY